MGSVHHVVVTRLSRIATTNAAIPGWRCNTGLGGFDPQGGVFRRFSWLTLRFSLFPFEFESIIIHFTGIKLNLFERGNGCSASRRGRRD